jgi:uncharacterized protein
MVAGSRERDVFPWLHPAAETNLFGMATDQHGMRILNNDECVAMLSTVTVGRLAVTERAMPIILPVTFGCLDGDIVFNIAPGVLLRAAESGHVACFEADV